MMIADQLVICSPLSDVRDEGQVGDDHESRTSSSGQRDRATSTGCYAVPRADGGPAASGTDITMSALVPSMTALAASGSSVLLLRAWLRSAVKASSRGVWVRSASTPGLGLEPLPYSRFSEVRSVQGLDRGPLIAVWVEAEVDHAHAAESQPSQQPVPAHPAGISPGERLHSLRQGECMCLHR